MYTIAMYVINENTRLGYYNCKCKKYYQGSILP